jgi:hypothetical protein
MVERLRYCGMWRRATITNFSVLTVLWRIMRGLYNTETLEDSTLKYVQSHVQSRKSLSY